MRYGVVAFVFCAVLGGVLITRPAVAMKSFLAEFKAMYVRPTSDRARKIFNEAVEKKKCTICHMGTPAKPKKGLNSYGKQLQTMISKRDADNVPAIRAALTKVASMHSTPNDLDSPTFKQRLSEGKLPVGEIHVKSKEGSNSPAEK
jgi:hypothetical protein